MATWVVLHDREGGREFLFVNTHLDHVGQVARDEGVNLLRERIEALRGDRPVILTGDFNSEPGSSATFTRCCPIRSVAVMSPTMPP